MIKPISILMFTVGAACLIKDNIFWKSVTHNQINWPCNAPTSNYAISSLSLGMISIPWRFSTFVI